jgi:hypothetical protein
MFEASGSRQLPEDDLLITAIGRKTGSARQSWYVAFLGYSSTILAVTGLLLAVSGVFWNYSTRRYLKGFADAIVPLQGSPQEKTEALLSWLRDKPQRNHVPLEGAASLRDPVNILQNGRLLKICGSASNAFINLADVAGLRTRRLLLLDQFGGTKHVIAEVKWGDRWVAVDPQQHRVFQDQSGRALTKEDLRDPKVFQDAISRIPGYSPAYTFEHTAHVRLQRIPIVGNLLRRVLDRLFPTWEESIDWGFAPENPSLWPILLSLPSLLLAALARLIVRRHKPTSSSVVEPVMNNSAPV